MRPKAVTNLAVLWAARCSISLSNYGLKNRRNKVGRDETQIYCHYHPPLLLTFVPKFPLSDYKINSVERLEVEVDASKGEWPLPLREWGLPCHSEQSGITGMQIIAPQTYFQRALGKKSPPHRRLFFVEVRRL